MGDSHNVQHVKSREDSMSVSDEALIALLRRIQCEPLSFDNYMVSSTAERAADAIDSLRAEVARQRDTRRWNIEQDGNDLLVCFDNHDKSEKCEYVRFVPSTEVARLTEKCARADALAEAAEVSIPEMDKSGNALSTFNSWRQSQLDIAATELREALSAYRGAK